MSIKGKNILLLGSGGRESALARKLSQSELCGNLFIAPGNGGTGRYGTNVALSPLDFDALAAFVDENNIDLVVAGNEDPLVAGIYDYFATRGVPVLGPSKEGARLEGSKDFAKQFMMRHGIPTARYSSFTAGTAEEGCRFLESLKPPYVLKADGLAAGKGVLIIDSIDEARQSLRRMLAGQFGKASAKVVIEQFLSGIECSVFVLTDGTGEYIVLPPAKDYKRIGEGDTGLNTGGMGAVCPPPFVDDEFMAKIDSRIIKPTLAGLAAEGIDYRGFIFLGLINCGGEPLVIEYNVRMGDPETEAVMPRIASDLLPVLEAAADARLKGMAIETDPRTSVTVMAVSGGYPGDYEKGKAISGNLAPAESIIFHAGTAAAADGKPVTAGGRVLTATSYGRNISEAAALSYKALEGVHFDGMYFRRDIGRDLLPYE